MKTTRRQILLTATLVCALALPAAKADEKGRAAAKEGGADTGANTFEIYQITKNGVALQATIAGTKSTNLMRLMSPRTRLNPQRKNDTVNTLLA